jgi:hypothetical protein
LSASLAFTLARQLPGAACRGPDPRAKQNRAIRPGSGMTLHQPKMDAAAATALRPWI